MSVFGFLRENIDLYFMAFSIDIDSLSAISSCCFRAIVFRLFSFCKVSCLSVFCLFRSTRLALVEPFGYFTRCKFLLSRSFSFAIFFIRFVCFAINRCPELNFLLSLYTSGSEQSTPPVVVPLSFLPFFLCLFATFGSPKKS